MAANDHTKGAATEEETPKTNSITGIQSKDNHSRPFVRKDIDERYIDQINSTISNGIQLTLFVRALGTIQKRDVITNAPTSAWRVYIPLHGAPGTTSPIPRFRQTRPK